MAHVSTIWITEFFFFWINVLVGAFRTDFENYPTGVDRISPLRFHAEENA